MQPEVAQIEGGVYQGAGPRTELNRPRSPSTLMRKTKNPLGAQVKESHRDRPHPSSEIQGWGDGSKDVPELLPWPDVQPSAQPNEDCPRTQAVEELLNSDRGWGWIEEISKGLRLHPNLRPLLRSRIRFLLMRGDRVAMDFGMINVGERLLIALDTLRGDVWSCVLRDSTSPVTLLLGLDLEVLDRGIGQVGNIPIPEFIWDPLTPLDFSHVAARNLGTMPDIFAEGLIMARALVRDGILKPCGGGGPNGYPFPVPKNATKASMIVHLVRFNKQHQLKPHSFCLPSVEDFAFLVQVHSMLPPRLSMNSAYMSYVTGRLSGHESYSAKPPAGPMTKMHFVRSM